MKLKSYSIMACAAIGIISSSHAQNTTEMPVVQTISVQKGQQQVVHDKAYFEQKIQDIDVILSAIDEKVKFVQSNEEEHKLALENGWYKQMDESKVHAKRARQEYVIRMSSIK